MGVGLRIFSHGRRGLRAPTPRANFFTQFIGN